MQRYIGGIVVAFFLLYYYTRCYRVKVGYGTYIYIYIIHTSCGILLEYKSPRRRIVIAAAAAASTSGLRGQNVLRVVHTRYCQTAPTTTPRTAYRRLLLLYVYSA